MDIVSHGLWGAISFGRQSKKNYLLAFLFGIAPDLFSFGIFSFMTALGLASGPDWGNGLPANEDIPLYVHTLYNITHSLVIFLLVFLLMWFIHHKPFLPLAAWGLHIILDIPTHSTQFFATPFLWPISEYRVDAISWSHPSIFYPNIIALMAVYGWWWYSHKTRK